MGLFDGSKMSKSAGRWAATAMGCMVYADGEVDDAEVNAALGQIDANPIFEDSIGSKKAGEIFNETVEAIGQIPSAMLPTYEVKLAGLAEKIKGENDKNFALTTVIAVSMGDGSLSQSEADMLNRFQQMLGATIPVPAPGDKAPKAQQPASQPKTAEKAAGDDPVDCGVCGKDTKYYEGYGHWCAECQKYTKTDAQPGTDQPAAEPVAAEPVAAEPAKNAAPAAPAGGAPAVECPLCNKPTAFFEGYGHWCADCQKYATV